MPYAIFSCFKNISIRYWCHDLLCNILYHSHFNLQNDFLHFGFFLLQYPPKVPTRQFFSRFISFLLIWRKLLVCERFQTPVLMQYPYVSAIAIGHSELVPSGYHKLQPSTCLISICGILCRAKFMSTTCMLISRNQDGNWYASIKHDFCVIFTRKWNETWVLWATGNYTV